MFLLCLFSSVNGELFCEFKFSPFATKRRSVKNEVIEKSLALSLKRALLPAICRYAFTNFQVDIYINVIEDDGSVLAAAITAAGLAIADAGIPMYDIVTATSVAVLDNDRILIDPTKNEEEACNSVDSDQEHGTIIMSSLHTLEQVSELWCCGLMCSETVTRLTDVLLDQNKQIVPIIQQILVNKVKNSIDEHENYNKK